jgi:nicotinamidase-related amidase
VPHCIKGTDGWQIRAELDALRTTEAIDKITFGSRDLVDVLAAEGEIESITFIGLCTDICVISNAMVVKAFYPEIPLLVDAKACAGVSPESHSRALEAMKICQIKIVNEEK